MIDSACPVPGARELGVPEGRCTLGVALIGEALGDAEEHDGGLPFRPYAEAGAILERAISRAGYSRDQFVLYNAVPAHPPRNYLEGAPYEAAALAWGHEYLEKVIHDYRVRAIVALGGVPLRSCTGMSGAYRGVSHLRGWVLPSAWGVPVVPAYHPSFIRRGALPLFPDLMHCIKLAVAIASTKPDQCARFFSPVLWRDYEVKHPARWPDPAEPVVPAGYHLHPSESDAWDFVRELELAPGRLLAYDIETPRSTDATEEDTDELGESQIISIQFSAAPGSGIFMPWREPFIAPALAALALPNPKAGANTWRFDDPLLAAHGARLAGVRHDVRWAFHHLQPDAPASLQHIASYYCPLGEWAPWKHQHESHKEFYGIRDCDAVQWIMHGTN